MGAHDSFIDEEDDTCPLCIEEFDLSDRNFHPCPCGYQVCQFCFNNIKSNMNGLCPACRRPYDEKTILWKVVTPEEVAEFKANIQKNQKKRAQEQRQKEALQRQVQKDDRKNLVGVRVIQKNLVYVTGLQPTVREDELMKTLRKQEFFGQYGNIQKISISHRKSTEGQNQSLGIYVTFDKKEDAARCIQAVNGSQNGDRVLRAQLGTTKYCSAWLRHEQCTNRQCMFLHEQGDEEDSYTRQDLSSMNSIDSQRKAAAASNSRSASRQQLHTGQQAQAQAQALAQAQTQTQAQAQDQAQAQAAAAAAGPGPISQPMARSSSKGSDTGDNSALPSSANWARNPQRSRRGSHATSGAADSPATSNALPVTAESALESSAASSSSREVNNSHRKAPTPQPAARSAPRQEVRDPLVMALIQGISKLKFKPMTYNPQDYPPLFDPQGGAKRRAMREVEKPESEAAEPTEIQEPSEGEPESGSLALGGEPEGDPVRDFDQRRGTSSQPPIQKNIREGIFGPRLDSFGPTTTGVGAIGARTATPQQPLYAGASMGPAASGAFERAPPGMATSQSPLFQQQGHQRGSSRYSFANDNAPSATNVKLAGNPRAMAQQASMMPQLHAQHSSSQYYGTSMPGPPPGLKSSGTPPNPFHSSFSGGSGIGASKESDMLQMMRRSGATGNAHEKRELHTSSPFSNQFPPSSSSTPAPASGLLGSLYGTTPPGTFQDFGHKQKKKGKKHRHANTSSSGGSGLVDLADPSILQARMQHQQQGNAGVGQTPFGGQSQDDDELPSLDEASEFVDALVSVDAVDALVSDDPEPPKLTPLAIRSATPSIPPGLSPRAPPGLAPPTALRSPSMPESLTAASQGSPIAAPKTRQGESKSGPGKKAEKLPQPIGPRPSKESGKSSKGKGKGVLNDEEFPALEAVKPAAPTKRAAAPALPAKQPVQIISTTSTIPPRRVVSEASPVAAPSEQHQPSSTPPRSTKAEKKVVSVIGTSTATTAKKASNPQLIDLTTTVEGKFSSDSPAAPTVIRAAPKTIKIVSTAKPESTPAPPAATVSSNGVSSAQPAVRSIAAASTNRPETPASELISDSASIISGTISNSRPGSPPPSKLGSAPVRSTTKSKQRKQRKDAQKEIVDAITTAPKVEAAEIGPIVGRKKKQQKPKPPKKAPTAESQSAASRPQTPPSQPAYTKVEVQSPVSEQTQVPSARSGPGTGSAPAATTTTLTNGKATAAHKNKRPNSNRKGRTSSEPKAKAKDQQQQQVHAVKEPQSEKAAPVTVESDAARKDDRRQQPMPGVIYRELVDDVALPEADKLAFLKAMPPTNWRHEPLSASHFASAKMTYHRSVVSDEDQETLLAAAPVRKSVEGISIMLTPNGDCVRNLSKEEEDRYLDLQQHVAEANTTPAAFIFTRHEPSGGFSLIKGRAVPNGPPSYFPQAPDSYPSDPVNKIQRDEAISYINQYVLPRLGLGAPPSAGPGSSPYLGSGAPPALGLPNGWKTTGDEASLAHTASGPRDSPDLSATEVNLNNLFYGPSTTSNVSASASDPAASTSARPRNSGATLAPEDDEKTSRRSSGASSAGATAGSPNSGSPAPNGITTTHTVTVTGGGNGSLPAPVAPLMSLEDAEAAMMMARKETEKLEKSLNHVIKRNRRLLVGSGH